MSKRLNGFVKQQRQELRKPNATSHLAITMDKGLIRIKSKQENGCAKQQSIISKRLNSTSVQNTSKAVTFFQKTYTKHRRGIKKQQNRVILLHNFVWDKCICLDRVSKQIATKLSNGFGWRLSKAISEPNVTLRQYIYGAKAFQKILRNPSNGFSEQPTQVMSILNTW